MEISIIISFCSVRINPQNQLASHKQINSILLELSKKLKIQEEQKVLADAWKPYMKNLDMVYKDASCNKSLKRFPTDVNSFWDCVERAYKMMCGIISQLVLIQDVQFRKIIIGNERY